MDLIVFCDNSDMFLKTYCCCPSRLAYILRGYSQKLINRCNQEIIKPKFHNNDNERKVIVTAPYIKGVTERIDKILRPYLKLCSIVKIKLH